MNNIEKMGTRSKLRNRQDFKRSKKEQTIARRTARKRKQERYR